MMRVSIKITAAADLKADLVAIPMVEAAREAKTKGGRRTKAASAAEPPTLPRRLSRLDTALGGVIASALASGDFTARVGETALLYPTARAGAVRRVLLIGLGKQSAIDAERLRSAGGAAARQSRQRRAERVALLAPSVRGLTPAQVAAAVCEGAVLGGYHFDAYLSGEAAGNTTPKQLAIAFEKLTDARGVRRATSDAVIRAESQNLARDLSNEPPNALPPSILARRARAMARKTGLRCRVMARPELERLGMKALLAVGQGSVNPPHLVVLEHRGKTKARNQGAAKGPICIVGKGITFDSGGISLKPAANMGDMKHDMSGAAAVVGIMRAVALLDLPGHVIGVIAAAENMPSGTAYRPGDIIGSHAGKTIEITNTDAEGRLVLADALHYACQDLKASQVVDIATLTGAAAVALGPWATAVLGNDDALIEAMRASGKAAGELIWPMPLVAEHKQAMRSTVADLKNSGGREAGASTAAAFLSNFVGDTPWAHLDIAGTGWAAKQSPTHRGGATGVTVRSLVGWLCQQLDAGTRD
jgi:leucyl aminopeptidase